jgi:hypothetical protein
VLGGEHTAGGVAGVAGGLDRWQLVQGVGEHLDADGRLSADLAENTDQSC